MTWNTEVGIVNPHSEIIIRKSYPSFSTIAGDIELIMLLPVGLSYPICF
jgi:hypothetical protein